MIALDTNVIIRMLTRDHERQTEIAEAVLASLSATEPGFLATVVWAELHRVLRNSYGLGRAETIDRIDDLLQSADIRAEDPSAVEQAIVAARGGADFADALIGHAGSRAGCRETVTFDKKAAAHLGWRAL